MKCEYGHRFGIDISSCKEGNRCNDGEPHLDHEYECANEAKRLHYERQRQKRKRRK